jgi:hypothetical protein
LADGASSCYIFVAKGQKAIAANLTSDKIFDESQSSQSKDKTSEMNETNLHSKQAQRYSTGNSIN